MGAVLGLITSEQGVAIAAWLVGAVWAWTKRQEWYRARVDADRARAVEAIEAGVAYAYAAYVRQQKAVDGGKLSDQSRAEAREIAKRKAAELSGGATNRMDSEFVDLYLEQAIQRAKKG